jgi:hypothetical protein
MTSRKLQMADIEPLAAWNSHRAATLQHIIQLKQARRVALGAHLSVVFENRQTVLFQVQEVLRAEFITEPECIRAEIDGYNRLIPEPGELCATLFIELLDSRYRARDIGAFVGVERAVELRVAEYRIAAQSDLVEPSSGRTQAVHYLRFSFTSGEAEVFGRSRVELAVRLPRYRASAQLSGATAAALAEDLAADIGQPTWPALADVDLSAAAHV